MLVQFQSAAPDLDDGVVSVMKAREVVVLEDGV